MGFFPASSYPKDYYSGSGGLDSTLGVLLPKLLN